MNILEIIKSPFNGKLINRKLEIKQSLIINLILACLISLVFIICFKSIANGFYKIFGSYSSDMKNLFIASGISNVISQLVLKLFVLFTINFILISIVFSGILFLIGKFIFKNNTDYKEYLSVCTYANILPVTIMLISCLFSLFSFTLYIIGFMVQVIILIILTYEGINEIIYGKKVKIIYSISIAYIINSILFFGINYFILMSLLQSKMNNLFY